ncbi:hypothetical protein VTK73DRAFT_6026 [Phialemonium thermophilum]|uniref:ABC transporter domain-containing protein n=1 Tax=Phialemonium thermophilum TaxID=223376 RepID=A0ABR3V163_9PEZI
MAAYFAATEINTVPVSSGERLVYREGHVPAPLQGRGGAAGGGAAATADEEKASPDMEAARRRTDEVAADPHPDASSSSSSAVQAIPPQRDVFTWRDVVYDIEVRGGQRRRLLDQVSGWVKPGTLTALMGVSGAGKTTLLDVLAQRTTVGVVTGDMLVNGRPRGANFQRSTGYVQQQGECGAEDPCVFLTSC